MDQYNSSEEIAQKIQSLLGTYADAVRAESGGNADQTAVIKQVKAIIQEQIDAHQKLLDNSWQSPNSEIEKDKEGCVVDTLRSVMDAIEELA